VLKCGSQEKSSRTKKINQPQIAHICLCLPMLEPTQWQSQKSAITAALRVAS